MLTILLGKKGTGKTKKLLELCAAATESSNGVVVFIEKDNTLTLGLSHKTRLACADEYGIFGFASLYGYIAGMCSANYDVTDVYVDSTMKIGGGDLASLEGFVDKLAKLSDQLNINVTLSVSADISEVPADVKTFIQEL
ncbi:MAG: hypothetical protein IJE00_02410 [Clostridia bacterium]|nr:hypothetical protein [Clostridia bacterium]MBQ2939199.1 hypothetical protein [Clostridia bacterium]